MDIEVENSTGLITSIGSGQIPIADQVSGYSYFDDVSDTFEVDGTYIDSVYTAPTWEQAWIKARDEIYGTDPKGIMTGSDMWMKCVRNNDKGYMNGSCKISISLAYQ